MQERDVARAAQPPEPRRGSTVEMVDRIKAEELKAEELKGLISNPAVKIEPKEPPRGR